MYCWKEFFEEGKGNKLCFCVYQSNNFTFCCDRHLVHEHDVCPYVHYPPLLFFLLFLFFFLFLLLCFSFSSPTASFELWLPVRLSIPSGLSTTCQFLIPVIFRFSPSLVSHFSSLLFHIPSILCLLTGNILVTKLPVYCRMFKKQQRDIAK